MTYTYTPQAGDVIESPDGKTRYNVTGVLGHMSWMTDILTHYQIKRRSLWTLYRWVWDDPVCKWAHVKSKEDFATLVTDHGWKLVARKDQ